MLSKTVIWSIAAAFICLAPPALAQSATLGEALDKGAKKLEKADLDALMSGSRYEGRSTSGTDRSWTHAADGRLDAQARGAFANTSPRGTGTWRVSDDGQYCVDIAWGSAGKFPEKWCLHVFQQDGMYYGVRDAANRDAKPLVFNIRK